MLEADHAGHDKVNPAVPLVTARAYFMIKVHYVVVLTTREIKKHGFREDGGTWNDETYTVLFVHHRYPLLGHNPDINVMCAPWLKYEYKTAFLPYYSLATLGYYYTQYSTDIAITVLYRYSAVSVLYAYTSVLYRCYTASNKTIETVKDALKQQQQQKTIQDLKDQMAVERESHRHSERYTQEIAMQLISAKLPLFEVFRAHRSSRCPWRLTPKGESGSTVDALYAQAVIRMYNSFLGEVPAPIS
eukprot:gene19567-23403_t